MTESTPQSFEEKLARVDQIVKDLEGGSLPLQVATERFREGKRLAAECEALLKSAQEEIDKAMGDEPKP